jgi:hypothetical protein
MDILVKSTVALMMFAVATTLSGCGTKQAELAQKDADPCSVLSSAEIESVQGEAVSSAKGDRGTTGPFMTSQCFYTLPTYNKSVSVTVMRASEISAVTDFWIKRFHSLDPDKDEEAVESSETTKNASADREAQEEKEKARPQAVSGIGDEAFWAGTQVNGALYVRRNRDIIRVSIGGADDQAVKIDKAKSLGEKVIGRL